VIIVKQKSIMVKKLLLITSVLLLTLSSQSNPKVSDSELGKLVAEAHGFNRADVIEYAKKYLGIRYHYASRDPKNGFDCSGFVSYVFKKFHVELPRSSKGYGLIKSKLKPEEFKVGDVIVFYGFRDNKSIGHVGIICEANGMKSKFIHSSSGNHRGVTISELGSRMYTNRFYKCVDVINDEI
jgi:cell wall-associated NlpC family hydrolase